MIFYRYIALILIISISICSFSQKTKVSGNIKDNITHIDKEKNVEYIVTSDEQYSLNVLVDYDSSVLSNQYASLNTISDFSKEIAKARTFVFLHELEHLIENNLVKGAKRDTCKRDYQIARNFTLYG